MEMVVGTLSKILSMPVISRSTEAPLFTISLRILSDATDDNKLFHEPTTDQDDSLIGADNVIQPVTPLGPALVHFALSPPEPKMIIS